MLIPQNGDFHSRMYTVIGHFYGRHSTVWPASPVGDLKCSLYQKD